MSFSQRFALVERARRALFILLGLATCIAALGACSSAPSQGPSSREGLEAAPESVTATRPIEGPVQALGSDLAGRTARLASEALSRSLSGAFSSALEAADAALESALDIAGLAVALEARAWTLLLAGSSDAARAALSEAEATGAPRHPGRAVLQFRLAAEDGLAEAAATALATLAGIDAAGRATAAVEVMSGVADLRDLPLDSPEAAEEYAGYLAGYRMVSEPGPLPGDEAPLPKGEAPLVVVTEPEAVGTDEATAAVARLACRDAMTRSGRYRVVDTASRAAALEELELSLASSPARARDIAIGELYSADYVAGGSVVKTDSGWLVAYTLSSADSGAILASDFSMAGDHAAILESAARFASSLDGQALAPASR